MKHEVRATKFGRQKSIRSSVHDTREAAREEVERLNDFLSDEDDAELVYYVESISDEEHERKQKRSEAAATCLKAEKGTPEYEEARETVEELTV